MAAGAVTGDGAAAVTGAAAAGVEDAPEKFRFDVASNGLAEVVLVVVPRAAAAAVIAAEFGSVAPDAVAGAAVASAGAAATLGPAELNVLLPPGSIVAMSFTPPKKLMLLCGLKGF